MTHVTKITNEKNRAYAARFVGNLDVSDDNKWRVSVEPWRSSRSLEQNALYHSWLQIIANDTGNSHDAMAEHCKQTFLAPQFYDIGGDVREYRQSTTRLSTKEMADYMDQIHAWAASDLGITLPLPPPRAEER